MDIRTFCHSLFTRPSRQFAEGRKTRRRPQSRPLSTCKPSLESLEDRTLPSSGWAAALGTTGSSYVMGVALDPSHAAVFVAGTQVAKYTTDGNLLWSQSLNSSYLSPGISVAVDADGAAYVTGQFTGTLALGSQTLTSAGDTDAFVAKFDPSGAVLWAKSFGEPGSDFGKGIAVNATGVYVSGTFSNTVVFDSAHSLTSTGGWDVFVLKLDASGDVVYATQAGGTADDRGDKLTVDGSGQVYITGYFAETANFGSLNLTAIGGPDAFIAQLNADGNFLWARQISGDNAYGGGTGVALDGSGHLFASGVFYATAAFGDSRDGAGATTLTSQGRNDAYVTSLDAGTGQFLWAKQIGGASTPTYAAGNLSLDGAGNVYMAGQFYPGAIDCDPGPGSAILTSFGISMDGFVTELSPTGSFLGAWQMGGSQTDSTNDIAVGADGSVYTVGMFRSAATFDTGTQFVSLTSSGRDGFVSRMTPDRSVTFGLVFNDMNHNAVKDTGDAPYAGVTVYLDTNNNGVRNTGEPYTTTNAQGGFSFYHLAPGPYTVREVVPAGYTITTATSFTVTLAAGQFDDSSSFGDYRAPRTTTYSNTNPVTTKSTRPNAISTISISDVYPIQDLSITLNVSNSAHRSLTIYLYAPDGTVITLASSITSTGTLTYHVPALIGKNVNGLWTLEVDGLSGGALNSWSLSVFG